MNPRDELQRIQERLLVLQAQQNDHTAFQQLVKLYEKRLLYYIRRLVGDCDHALDILQDVWLTVFRRIGSLKSPEAFRVWVYRITHDQTVTLLRRHHGRIDVIEDCSTREIEDSSWNELELLENAELVHRELERLSPAHREVLTLRFLESMSLDEIAEVIDCSNGTAKSRLHYAKKALRSQIEGQKDV
ncbi:MAG: sigma-70 family RNA polymerase sigma factor [Planctomycetes bacterium]|nr:sigma-70 family RNA polymerase sigma factor [Planctomycetota bacterium]